jgi:hypothetical protein
MAQLNEDVVVIKVSQLLRDDENKQPILNEELVKQLQEVLEQLVPNSMVEIART